MKQTKEERQTLAQDRALVSTEIHQPNDWYSHAQCIKRYAGVNLSSPLKAVIEHCPSFGGIVESFESGAPLPAILVNSQARAVAFAERSPKAIFVIGSMISYAEHLLTLEQRQLERQRLGRNLLVMPAHSTSHIDANYQIDSYCKAIAELAKDFDNVQVCLYWKDILRGLDRPFESYGFEIVTAGHMYDPKFLPRLKSILDAASIVTMNLVGTNAGFAVQLGKPVHFMDPEGVTIERSKQGDPSVWVPDFGRALCYQERVLMQKEMRELRDDISENLLRIVTFFWGLDFVRSPQELSSILQISEEMYSKGAQFFISNPSCVEQQAAESLERGAPKNAVLLLKDTVAREPQNPERSYLLACAFEQLKLFDRALEVLKSANGQDSKSTELLKKLIDRDAVEADTGAGPDFQLSSPSGPTTVLIQHAEELMTAALDLLKRGDPGGALQIVFRAKALNVSRPNLNYLHALCCLSNPQGNFVETAKELLLEELKYYPENSAAKEMLAKIGAATPSRS